MAFISMFPRFKVEMPALNDCSWDTIATYAASGLAGDIWKIGDTKTFSIDGVDYTAVIAGFNHDDLADGTGKAGITFALQTCLATKYRLNSTDTNSGGWGGCAFRATLQGDIFEQLETSLKNVIKPVIKKASAGSQSTTINSYTDTLFLFAEIEVFGTSANSVAGEGEQYDYFTASTARIKTVNGTASTWALRSPAKSYSARFCGVTTAGAATTAGGSLSTGIVFGFCV